ncbi:MAG: hypothetical protein NT099_03580 [Candidatus Saganbacteria bacterium]|nr:hypothetical protein [Candidatus Saganbacteria bacterium]
MSISLSGTPSILASIKVPLRSGEKPSPESAPQLQRKELRFITNKLLPQTAPSLPVATRRVRENDLDLIATSNNHLEEIVQSRSPSSPAQKVALDVLCDTVGIEIPEQLDMEIGELAQLFCLSAPQSRLNIYFSLPVEQRADFLKLLGSSEQRDLLRYLTGDDRARFWDYLDNTGKLELLELMNIGSFTSFLCSLTEGQIKDLFELMLSRGHKKHYELIGELPQPVVSLVFELVAPVYLDKLYFALTIKRRKEFILMGSDAERQKTCNVLGPAALYNLFSLLNHPERQVLYGSLNRTGYKKMFDALSTKSNLLPSLYFTLNEGQQEALLTSLNAKEQVLLYYALKDDRSVCRSLFKSLKKIGAISAFMASVHNVSDRISCLNAFEEQELEEVFQSLSSGLCNAVLTALEENPKNTGGLEALFMELHAPGTIRHFLNSFGEKESRRFFEKAKRESTKFTLAVWLQRLYPEIYQAHALPWLKGGK